MKSKFRLKLVDLFCPFASPCVLCIQGKKSPNPVFKSKDGGQSCKLQLQPTPVNWSMHRGEVGFRRSCSLMTCVQRFALLNSCRSSYTPPTPPPRPPCERVLFVFMSHQNVCRGRGSWVTGPCSIVPRGLCWAGSSAKTCSCCWHLYLAVSSTCSSPPPPPPAMSYCLSSCRHEKYQYFLWANWKGPVYCDTVIFQVEFPARFQSEEEIWLCSWGRGTWGFPHSLLNCCRIHFRLITKALSPLSNCR